MDTHQGYMSTLTTLNKYLYTGGNAVMHLDPSGQMFLAQFNASQQMMGILATSSLPIAYVVGQELAQDNTIGGGYSPVQLGWLTIAGMSAAGSQIV